MPQTLPLTPSRPHYTFSTTLAGTDYVFTARWNARAETWYLDLFDVDENPIRQSMAVVLGAPLGARSAHPDFPAGAFVASDLSGEQREAKLDDLGDRVQVYFYTPEELAAL